VSRKHSKPPSPQVPVPPRTVAPRAPDSLPLDQRRHQFAWERLKAADKALRTPIDTEVQGLPVALRTQGLGVVVATLLHRSRRESRWIADALGIWLLGESPHRPFADPGGEETPGRRLLDAVIQCRDSFASTAALREAIAVASAIKRLSGALHQGTEAAHGG
jgi:CRISPR-associated protein, Cmr5 family